MENATTCMIGLVLLIGLVTFVWVFKWFVLGASVLAIILIITNKLYKRTYGKDMPLYTSMIGAEQHDIC